jgi:hypothetical protein
MVQSGRPVDRRTRATSAVIRAGLTIATVVGAYMASTAIDPPDVADITFENATAFHVHVEGIGWAQRGGSTSFDDVIDQGDEWVLRLDYGGVDAGTIRLGRDELEQSGWHVAIPPSAEQALRDGGRVPQP